MVNSCPHSLYFFRTKTEHFEFINDFGGNKTAEELTESPNPLLIPDNEGQYYRSSDDFKTTSDYVEGAGKDIKVGDYIIVSRIIIYNPVTPSPGDDPYMNGWYERTGQSGNYVYELTTDRTVVSGKTYYMSSTEMKFDDFGDTVTNTFRDWHIMPLGRPTISPPQQKLQIIDIPGANGVMDLSNSLTKYPVFNNRTGTMVFAVDYDKTDWLTAYTKALNYLQGTKVRMILEDDPLYFFEGRIFVDDFNSRNDGTWSEITLAYDLEPYRKSIYTSTNDDWLWDPFNFETDVIQSSVFKAIQVTAPESGSTWTEVNFKGSVGSMPVIPDITVDTVNNRDMIAQLYNSDLGYNWKQFNLPEKGGSYKLYDLILCEETPESEIKMRFKNPGVVTLDFRSGRL